LKATEKNENPKESVERGRPAVAVRWWEPEEKIIEQAVLLSSDGIIQNMAKEVDSKEKSQDVL